MSYSRWGSSDWYTFWCSSSEEIETKDNAIFEICGVTRFTAKELRNDIKSCLATVKELQPNADEEDIDELSIYMRRFLKDVDKEYNK